MATKPRADPEELSKKQFIKKVVREEIAKNSRLEKFLTDRKIKGQYIANITNKLMIQARYGEKEIINMAKSKIHSDRPIDYAFTWAATPQGHYFWRELQNIYSEELIEDDPSYKIF